MIGVICGQTARYSAFADSLANIDKPPGTIVDFAYCSDRWQGRNALVEKMLAEEREYILFIDDDQVFGPELLTRLLSHNKGIVGGLYLRRDAPYTPLCYQHQDASGNYVPINLKDFPPGDLLKVVAIGTGGLLVRNYVFKIMDPPWFRPGEKSEDILFCEDVRESFPLYCDLGAKIGHMTTTEVWPTIDGNIAFKISEQSNIIIE